jgi:hypothetical protein
LIKYSLRWRIFPIRWTTEIIEWDPPHRFVDLQLKGPYKFWHHEHRFVAEGNGTRITDEVQYLLPFGPLGSIAHALKVKKDVQTIFAYRTKVVSQFSDERFSSRATVTRVVLLKFCVLRFGFFLDGYIGVGIFPQGEEILIGGFRFGCVSG